MHNILPTKKRLFQIKQKKSECCSICNVQENNVHMFVECDKIKELSKYFINVIKYLCDIRYIDMNKLIYLNFPLKNKKEINTVAILLASYLGTICYNRNQDLLDICTYKVKVLKHFHIIKSILKENMQKTFTEKYCKLARSLAILG